MTVPAAAGEILGFWFGAAADGQDDALRAAFSRWFAGDVSLDAEISSRFGSHVESALSGGLADWENEIRARLALVVLLDQFPRNMYRRTARAFAGDVRALQLARDAVRDAQDETLRSLERMFLLMPYQHAEDPAIQQEGVDLFRQLIAGAETDAIRRLLESSFEYAKKHCEIIARFGRFPYRNEVLGRPSTSEEVRWLKESAERFGQ